MFYDWERRQEPDDVVRNVRVLVVGDSTVGKTSLVEMICSGGRIRPGTEQWMANHEWTCGCHVSLARESVEVELRTAEVEVEIWEVGGAGMYSRARPVFYEGVDAVLVVYDVSNVKSYHNLVVWLFELCTSVWPPSMRYWDAGGGSGGVPDLEHGDGPGLRHEILTGGVPVLFVANKCDLRPKKDSSRSPGLPRPQLPDRPPLLERFLGGGDTLPASWRGTDEDLKLMETLRDFVQQGRHTEATSKAQSFDFALWRDFLRRTLEAKLQRPRTPSSPCGSGF